MGPGAAGKVIAALVEALLPYDLHAMAGRALFNPLEICIMKGC